MKLDKSLVYSMLVDVTFVLMEISNAAFFNQSRHYAKVLGAVRSSHVFLVVLRMVKFVVTASLLVVSTKEAKNIKL